LKKEEEKDKENCSGKPMWVDSHRVN